MGALERLGSISDLKKRLFGSLSVRLKMRSRPNGLKLGFGLELGENSVESLDHQVGVLLIELQRRLELHHVGIGPVQAQQDVGLSHPSSRKSEFIEKKCSV